MLDLLYFSFVSGFVVTIAPGLVNLIAFEHILNVSFRVGWLVSLGATFGQSLYVAGMAALYVYYGDAGYVQSALSHVRDVVESAKTYKELVAIGGGILIALAGLYYLRKKQSSPENRPQIGWLPALILTLGSVDYFFTYIAIFGVKTQGIISQTQGLAIVLAATLGVHACWLAKIGAVQAFKAVLIRKNWTNFNKITGWVLIIIGFSLTLWGIVPN